MRDTASECELTAGAARPQKGHRVIEHGLGVTQTTTRGHIRKCKRESDE